MKKSVLEYVQSALAVMDSDEVDDLNDTVESTQIAYFLRDLYYEMLNRQEWAFLHRSAQLVGPAILAEPTRIEVPDDVKYAEEISYNCSLDASVKRRVLHYIEPKEFLRMHSEGGGTRQLVTLDRVQFYVDTDKMPTYYTSFDDKVLYTNSYDSSVETTLTYSRMGCFAVVIPVFQVAANFVPDLPMDFVPLMQATLNNYCMANLKQMDSPSEYSREKRQLAQLRRNDSLVSKKDYYANKFGRR